MKIIDFYKQELEKEYTEEEMTLGSAETVVNMIKYIELAERIKMYKQIQSATDEIIRTISTMSLEDLKKMKG